MPHYATAACSFTASTVLPSSNVSPFFSATGLSFSSSFLRTRIEWWRGLLQPNATRKRRLRTVWRSWDLQAHVPVYFCPVFAEVSVVDSPIHRCKLDITWATDEEVYDAFCAARIDPITITLASRPSPTHLSVPRGDSPVPRQRDTLPPLEVLAGGTPNLRHAPRSLTRTHGEYCTHELGLLVGCALDGQCEVPHLLLACAA